MLQDIPTPTLREASSCVLETERLMLRRPTLADVKAIARLANDRRIAENSRRLPHPYSQDHAVAFVRAMAFTSASVGLRKLSRSVSRTQPLVSRNVGVGISCSISGSCVRPEAAHQTRKGEAGFPPPLEPIFGAPPVQRDPADHQCVHRLFGRGFSNRENRYEGAAVGFGAKLHMTFHFGEQGMVCAHADIKAGMPGGAALTRDDVAGNHMFAAIGLDSEALAGRISTVAR